MSDGEFARAQLDQMHSQHPELFPEAWGRGYALCGFTEPSRQQAGLRCRRVRLTADEGVFTVAPAWVMPYLTASVAEVEKAVLLMRFHVPCWALAQVFGRDAMFFGFSKSAIRLRLYERPQTLSTESVSWHCHREPAAQCPGGIAIDRPLLFVRQAPLAQPQ
jgi:hypothetical protein